MSFLTLHIDQHKADTPIRMKALDCLSTPFSQLPNIFVILVGDGRVKVKLIVRQSILANGHVMNKCSIVSCSPQKTHFVHPCHLLLARLSIVSNTLLLKNHINIFIFSGTLTFQRYFRKKVPLAGVPKMYPNRCGFGATYAIVG